MKKLKKGTTQKGQTLLDIAKLARKELAGTLKRHHEQKLRLRRKQIREAFAASRKAEGELSKKVAEFRFRHSKWINAALHPGSKYPPHFLFGQPFGGLPGDPLGDWRGNPKDNPKWKEAILIVKFLEEHFKLKPIYDPDALNRPLITSYPNTLIVGGLNYYSIVGQNFRASPGSLYITLTETGTRIDPNVISWTDTAIQFIIPSSVGGVPFHAPGELTVKNTDGFTDSVNVVVEPVIELYFSDEVTYSDSGTKYRGIPPGPDYWYEYEKEVTLESPALPEVYCLHNAPEAMPVAGLELHADNNSYVLGVGGLENPGSFTLIDGPYEVEYASGVRRLQIKEKIKDDWYWDYTIKARFYIDVPRGYYVPTGWVRV